MTAVAYWPAAGPNAVAATGKVGDQLDVHEPEGTAAALAAGGRQSGGRESPNALAGEISPYLLLHAHNPVNWYPWGREALEQARRHDRPIFLSVGYSTCYWCHVMEREIFSDPEIAALMNRWFVNIKVDREERPDLDQIYMVATQMVSGSGGWPNSVFLTPGLKPFYAGTYFPPEDAHGRPGFPRVLEALHQSWTERRAAVEMQAEQLTQAIRRYAAATQAAPMPPDSVLINRALAAVVGRYDARSGGFGGAPKFPPAIRLDFLLDSWQDPALTDSSTLAIVEHTLDRMAHGGIFDQVGGGFHRYATDAEWRVPHFEKMLYNQAQLAHLYFRAHHLSGNPLWRRIGEEILKYVRREMTGPHGGFYSALDAETEHVEGLYYLWTEDQVAAVLGEGTDLFFEVFALAPMPEVVAGRVMFMPQGLDEVATDLDRDPGALRAAVEQARRQLLHKRVEREYPLLDDKVLAAWNGMMISACATAFEVTGTEDYRRMGEAAADFVLGRMRTADGALGRSFRGGVLKPEGYLEDYAFMARGLLDLHRTTGDSRWLAAGHGLTEQLITRFWDREEGGFFYTENGTDLILRIKNAQDSALPSANAVVVHLLLELAATTGEKAYRDLAGTTLAVFGSMLQATPGAYIHMIAAARRYLESLPAAGGEPVTPAALVGATAPVPDLPDTLVRSRASLQGRLHPAAEFVAAVELEISEGWHINANPASSSWLVPTSLTVNADVPLEVLGVEYPAAQQHYLASQEDTLAVYAGRATLLARLRLAPEAAPTARGPLRLLIQYQACDAVRCLPPAQIAEVVMLELEEKGL